MKLARERRGDCATSTPIQFISVFATTQCLLHCPGTHYVSETSSRDGRGNCSPTKLLNSGMKQPPAPRRMYHMALELALRRLLSILASVRCRQPPGDATRGQTTLTGHYLVAGSDMSGRCPFSPAPSQYNHLPLCYCRNAADKTVFHGTYRRLDQPSCHRQLISGLVSKTRHSRDSA